MTVTGEYFYAAELHRLRGEIAFRQVDAQDLATSGHRGLKPHSQRSTLKITNSTHLSASLGEAERCFHKAIAIARQQRAKSFELRAVVSLCRLWQAQERWNSARQALRKIYRWFKEGLTTPDLQAARIFLEELDSQAQQSEPREKALAAS
jgi:hypothetical protein